jgi:hypothetical protein
MCTTARRPRQLDGSRSGDVLDIVYARGVPANPSIKSNPSIARTDLQSSLRSASGGTSTATRTSRRKRTSTTPRNNATTILGKGRPRVHSRRPRRHNPHRRRVQHRDRASQSPPLHRHHEKMKRPQDAGDNQYRSLYDTRAAKALLNKLCSLAQIILLGIILAHMQRKIREQTTGNTFTASPEGT